MGKLRNGNKKKYFRVERFLFKLGGISFTGDESLAYRAYSWVNLIVFNYMYPLIASLDLFKRNFNEAIDSWFYVVGTVLANSMISATSRNRLKVGRLLDRLEEEPFLANLERGSVKEEKLLKEWLSFSHKQAIVFSIGVIFSTLTQMIYTIISRMRSSDYHDWNMGFARINVVNVTYSPNYEISMLYQNLAICSMAFNCCSTTLIISGAQANIGTQFKLLQNNITRLLYISKRRILKETTEVKFLAKDPVDDYPKILWKYLQRSLKEMVMYHLAILDLAKELEAVFSQTMLSLYIGTLAMLCLEVYRGAMHTAIDLGTIRLMIELVSAIFHSMIICYSGEQMAHESEQVAKAVFQSEFFGTDLRFQKSLILIIGRSQNPVRIKAGKLIYTSMVTFAWILRTSYSSYMVLRNTNMQISNRN